MIKQEQETKIQEMFAALEKPEIKIMIDGKDARDVIGQRHAGLIYDATLRAWTAAEWERCRRATSEPESRGSRAWFWLVRAFPDGDFCQLQRFLNEPTDPPIYVLVVQSLNKAVANAMWESAVEELAIAVGWTEQES